MKKLTNGDAGESAKHLVKIPDGEYEFFITVKVTKEMATVEIAGPTIHAPFGAVMAATEHMMTMTAMMSPQKDFETALRLLCDGARSNHIKEFKGQRTQ